MGCFNDDKSETAAIKIGVAVFLRAKAINVLLSGRTNERRKKENNVYY